MNDKIQFKKSYNVIEDNMETFENEEFKLLTESAKYPLGNIADIFTDKFNFDPIYQRNYTWNRMDQSLLIESFILNVPVPPVYIYEVDYDQYELLDGKQRLTTLIRFYDNKLKIEGLQIKKSLNGKYFKDFSEEEKRSLNRRYVSAIILTKESTNNKALELEYKRIIFERINKRGESLNEQQLRKALYPGPGLNLIESIAKDPIVKREMQSIIQKIKSKNERDMKVEEYVLRTIGLRYIEFRKASSDSEYWTETLKCLNTFDKSTLKYIKDIIIESFHLVDTLVGEKAYRTVRNGKYSTENYGYIYEPMILYVMNNYERGNQISFTRESLNDFLEIHSKDFDSKRQAKNNILKRVTLFEEYFNGRN